MMILISNLPPTIIYYQLPPPYLVLLATYLWPTNSNLLMSLNLLRTIFICTSRRTSWLENTQSLITLRFCSQARSWVSYLLQAQTLLKSLPFKLIEMGSIAKSKHSCHFPATPFVIVPTQWRVSRRRYKHEFIDQVMTIQSLVIQSHELPNPQVLLQNRKH